MKTSDLKVGDKIYYFEDFEYCDFDDIIKCEPDEIINIDDDYNHYGYKYKICFGAGENEAYIPLQEETSYVYKTKEDLIQDYIEHTKNVIEWKKKQLKLAEEWLENDNAN